MQLLESSGKSGPEIEDDLGIGRVINVSTKKKLDLSLYKNKYSEKLTELIQMKIDGKEVVQVPSPEEPKIINLMEALKKSVAKAQAAGNGKSAPSKRAKRATPSPKLFGYFSVLTHDL